jgi:serine/threonine-protein kinase
MEAVAPKGRLAGRYLLEELIASGGMAEVWRARDDVLARMVAVKILRSDLAEDAALSERFQREAVAAARLNHPNIISVFDTGNDGGVRYIVMEHFAGQSLQEIEAQRAIGTDEAVSIMLPVLDALGFAHGHGVVHRDVKPGNILVGPSDRVKVTDFGIAKAAHAGADLTTTGALLGTVRYVSPEQVQGGPIDAAADLYSTGVVLYELLTGRPPFSAESDVATAMLRLTADPLCRSPAKGTAK